MGDGLASSDASSGVMSSPPEAKIQAEAAMDRKQRHRNQNPAGSLG